MRGLPPIALCRLFEGSRANGKRFRSLITRFALAAIVVVGLIGTVAAQQQKTFVDPNVNMVKGTTFPNGDPYLQRQNEPSIAVSTRNPCHLVAGANDYRSVDIPFDDTVPPNSENSLSLAGDAWLGLFKSFDCGAKWTSTLLPGYPQDTSNLAPALKGHAAGADPTLRAGTNGLFYYSGMVFNRGTQGTSKIFVSRLIDNNDKERGDPIQFVDVAIVDTGTKGQFLDKPWMAVDVPRTGYGPGSKLGGSATCNVNGQTIPAGNVYMAWAKFTGNGGQHSKLMFAKSSDCGKTFKQHPISNNQSLSQGANLAVAPHDGTLYLTWREFATKTGASVNFWITTSSDGGESWSAAKKIGSNVATFDQLRSISTFRSNALPAITADHENRAYVAWSARGAATYLDANGVIKSSTDARIMMVTSSDRGKTWSAPFAIDPVKARGHQLMPSLAFAAGRVQAIWYDAREDVAGVWGQYIDDAQATGLLHTIDVRGAQATPAAQPVFVAANELSHEVSKYRTWNVEVKGAPGTPSTNKSLEIGSNPPNLPMYANGTTPFIGDYIDVSGLPSFPVQTSAGQIWQPNVGALNLVGAPVGNLSTSGFPTLASFHATWTDNRDVNISQCVAAPPGQQVQMVGQRNANIYTARLTQGLYVGSPGNTKPFGYRLNPKTKQQELIQRGFVVFAQNTTDTLKFYRFKIETQPIGGRASLKQFDHNGPLTEVIVSVPAASTVAKTVYATSTDVNAQLLINIEQMEHDAGTVVVENGVSKKDFVWSVVANGLRGSVLLNPDRTNPPIQDPDVDSEVPLIATDEVHNPSMFDAQFFKRTTKSNKLDVLNARVPDPENPDPENPDPENPDPENPDPENPDPENPDPENPDPENPDPENPDPENPDPENPDPENLSLVNSTISDTDLQNATITDIQWKVHNSGNTTSAYKFRPSLPKTSGDQRFQLIVTRRSMALALGADCQPVYKSANQVLANIVNFQPKTPDPENPDPENPDPENPDPENPDPENPDPENPDPENANFFLPPDETATVTLRVFDLNPGSGEPVPETRAEVAAKTAAQAANTGQTTVSTAVAGPDLTLFDVPAAVAPAISRPGKPATVTFTLSNRGTGPATVTAPAEIRTRIYFSADQIVNNGDTLLATIVEPAPFAHCVGEDLDLGCSTTSSVNVTVPAIAGTSYVIIVTDPDEFVFEADELNNQVVVPIVVANYQLSFLTQPTSTTQDFTMSPAVVVAVTHPDNGSVTAADVPGVTLAIANNPSAGTLSGTVFRPTGSTSFGDLTINNAGNGYTLSAGAPMATGAISAAFNIEADLPPVVANDSHTTNEEQLLQPAAPGVLGNDSDPATKGTKPASYTFHAEKITDPSNGTVTVNSNGSFSYTPSTDFAGSDSFTYRAKDGRPGNETTGTVNITVTNVNDAPSFTRGADQVALEDSGAHSVPGWATAISKGPANEASQVVDFIVTNTNNALFSSQPAVAANGTLTYTSAANASGVATVSVRIHDSGGIANGGVDTSAAQTFTITITGDNDPPVAAADSYTTSEDTSVGRDAVDDPDALLDNDSDPENDVLVAEYLTTTTNGVLTPHANGSFSYAPNPNFFGTDSFTYRAFDGTTTGNTVTVTFTVQSVNDVPSFTIGANQSVPENSGAQTMANWATAISKGAANESAQTLNFIVSNDNGQLFSVAPAISPAGTLTFTPRANRQGVANVTVQLHDNGGTANGGVDTSAAQTFTIAVTNAATTFVVVNTNDSGTGSLRQAIINANANASADTITFNIPGTGVRTITPLSALPTVVFPVVINATTQPGFSGTPLIELNGASAGAGVSGLELDANPITVRGFIVNRFSTNGISIHGPGATVVGNYVGTDATGTSALGNNFGVVVLAGSAVVGGTTAADRNVISGNINNGIQVQNFASSVVIKGNYIGTDRNGASAVPNRDGVRIENVQSIQVGGDSVGEGNLISGNRFNGVGVSLCPTTSTCSAVIAGNKIGTNVAGTTALGNGRAGIDIFKSPNTVIRGNVISGNGGQAPPEVFTGSGIAILSEDVVTDPQAELHYGNHVIVGNKVGTDVTGLLAVPNASFGIVLTGETKARIGGPTAVDRNIIAFNNGNSGVHVGYGRSNNNTIQGNYIGVNASLQPAGNQNGVYITNSSSRNTVTGNVIGSHTSWGVVMGYGQQDDNVVTGNFIGTDSTGTAALGNGHGGIAVDGANNVVSQNRIANNGTIGVYVTGTFTGNRISQNSIVNNGLLGIDLDAIGVTANDAGDADLGPNKLQNFPVIANAFVNGGVATILGSLNSAPNSTYTIEFFSSPAADNSGYGEGQTYLGSLAVTTDGSGNAGIATTLSGATAASVITATATDADGNTSEFSQARVAVANNPPTATGDQVLTVSDFAMTTTPGSNDVDPDVAGPEVRTTYRGIAGAIAPLNGPGDVGVVTSTGFGYFTGGNQSQGTTGKIGILNTATNTVVGTIPLPGNFASSFSKVNQATKIVYFRGGNNLLAVDANPASATYHQLIVNLNVGTIQSWALDEADNRLYLTTLTAPGSGIINNPRITVIDTNPASGTFHQVIAEAAVPSLNGNVTALGVNAVTNKIYVGVTGAAPGVYVADAATLAMTQIFTSSSNQNISSMVVNDLDNMIYAIGGTAASGSALSAINGVNDTKVGQVNIAANASVGAIDSRLAVHRGTGRIYVRINGFPNASNLVVVDGKPGSLTFNQVVTTINLGRENGNAAMVVDEGVNRLIATSPQDLRSHVIDTTNNTIVATLMATQTLNRISIDPTQHRAYLTGGPGYVRVVNLATAAVVTDVHVGTTVWGIAVDPLTHSAYVSETGLTAAIKRLNETGISGTITLPHGDGREVYMARNSATNKIYALNGGATVAGGSDGLPGFVHVIDGSTNAVTANIAIGNQPFGVAIDEVNNKIYIGNQSLGASFPGGISILDGVTNAVTQANVSAMPSTSSPPIVSIGRDMLVTTSGRLYFRVIGGASTQMLGMLNGSVATPINLGNVNINLIKYNPVTNRLYVGAIPVAGGANQVFVLDASTNAVVATLTVGSPTNFVSTQSYVAVNTAASRVFISDFEENQLTVLDASTHAVVATIPMPFGPSTVAVDEVRNRIYVGNAIARSLTIVDGATLRVARTLALPIAPVTLFVDSSLTPARIFAHATENEAAISVIDDPGTAAPQITSVTQGAHGTVVLNADGSVTYTSTAGYVGSDSYTYTTSDGQGGTTTGTANVTVYAEMSIQPATLANGTIGQNYSQTLTRTGGSGSPVIWTVTGFLPGGLHLSSSGVLSGKPLQSGVFTFTVNARDTGQDLLSESKTYTLIVGPPALAPTSVSNGTINVPYSQQLFPGGVVGGVTWTLDTSGHPALSWLSLSSTGVLSGTPTTYGTTPSFTVTATDSSTPTPLAASRTYTIFVGGPLTMADLREGSVMETQPSVSFLGGNGTRALSITNGALPPGIVLGTGGVFTGTPTRHGTYNFTLQLSDCQNGSCGNPQTVNKNIDWRVSARDQQGNSFTGGPSLVIGGSPNRKVAQVFTVGAQGTLTAIGLSGVSCPVTQTTVTIEVQRLTTDGLPDGTTIATGSTQANFLAIAITPTVPVAIGERLAFIASVGGTLTCTISNAAPYDSYNAGDAYLATTGAWSELAEADVDNSGGVDGVYDIPSFRTLVMPAMDVTYLPASHGGNFAVVLNDGRVLIGGSSNSTNAAIYDPATNITTATGPMMMVRQNATATLLGNGTVLVAGGRDQNGNKNAQAEIFDPAGNGGVGTFTPITGHMLWNARDNHRAVRFVHATVEKVLITGGQNSLNTTLAAVEVYDPVTQTFSMLTNNRLARQSHAAVLLNTGKILIAGGYTNGSGPNAELFDPATNAWTITGNFSGSTGNMILNNRGQATATLLADGRVLIAGGQSGDLTNTAEIYNPATGQFTATGSMAVKRYLHAATLLADGTVLIAGGYPEQSLSSFTLPLATMERFDPVSGTFVPAGGMETRRANFAAALLGSGKALLAGGFSQGWMTGNTGELYDYTTAPSMTPTTLAAGSPGASYPAVVFSGSGGSGAPYAITHVGGFLPPGMAYIPSTRTLSGTPSATGLYQFALQVTDSAGHAMVQTLTLQVGSINTITSPYLLPVAQQNNPYSYQLAASGPGNVWSLLPPASATSSNPPPPGITLSSTGLLSGTPTTQNYYNFGVRAVDSFGVEATKIVAISVQSPMSITTVSLGNPELFSGLGCINTSNGNGLKTYSLAPGSGPLPGGVTFAGTTSGSCATFTGSLKQTGTFTFRVRITDSSFNPQTAEQSYTINVYAADQSTSSASAQIPFGAGTGTRLAERVITGITGTLRGVRLNGLTCTVGGTNVSVEIQGVDGLGKPNGQVLATGNINATFGTIYLNNGVFFAADQPFAIVVDAGASCSLRPPTFDSYTGQGFVSNGGGAWTPLEGLNPTAPQYDLPFTTVVEPVAGVIAMNAWRGRGTGTLLGNGKVLIAGGQCCTTPQAAELFNPGDNTTTVTGNMISPRQSHTATLLPDGKVLLVGGYNASNVIQSSAELYDPIANTFMATGSMPGPRASHRATLLSDNTVLITGGITTDSSTLNTALIYSNGTFTSVPNTMLQLRSNHTATRLDDDRVLIAGGAGTTAEIYSTSAQTFTATTGLMTTSRHSATATTLDDGKVLIAGGVWSEVLASTELFDPTYGTFAAAGMMSTPRYDHGAVKLDDGSVLVSGGYTDITCCYPKAPNASIERYGSGTFQTVGTMLVARYVHTMNVLADGRVFMSGTFGWSSAAGRTGEIYDASSPPAYLTANDFTAPRNASLGVPVTATGGSGPPYTVTLMSGTLPAGATYSNGQITGSTAEAGTFQLAFRIQDGLGRVSYQGFTLRIDPLNITTTSLPAAEYNVPYTGGMSSSGGVGSITWSIVGGSLPPTLSLNQNTGGISGTPIVGCCVYSVTIRATDSIGQTAQRSFNVLVQTPFTIGTTSLFDGLAGSNYWGGLWTSAGTAPFTWSPLVGAPQGLQVDPLTGSFLNGYPNDILRQGGTFVVTAQVTDSSQPAKVATANLPLTVWAQDQATGSLIGPMQVPMSSTRKFAQVYRSGSPSGIAGVSPYQLYCDPNITLTAKVYPVDGLGAPDDSEAPMATGTLTADSNGFFPSPYLRFTPAVSLPAGTKFAVVYSNNGFCGQNDWPTADYYSFGEAYVKDGTGSWSETDTVPSILRGDLPHSTLILPPSDLRFLAGWRGGHASAMLDDGKIFLAGSDQYTETYDPETNTLTLGPSMNHERQDAVAALMPGGKVLITGGQYWDYDLQQTTTAVTTQLYNPGTGQFEASQNMAQGRRKHTITVLDNGRVLIAGGERNSGGGWLSNNTADLFDSAGQSLVTLGMGLERSEHTATLLADGRVLILGGVTQTAGDVGTIYDPLSGTYGTFTPITNTFPNYEWPTQHTATLLTTGPRAGQVLIDGGWASPSPGGSFFFNPADNTFTTAPAMLVPRFEHKATMLPNGRIVYTGGVIEISAYSSTASVEIYDPVTNQRSLIGNLMLERSTHSADLVATPNGLKLAVAAGYGHSSMTGFTIEQFDLGSLDGDSGNFAAATNMLTARTGHLAVALDNGDVLLTGGINSNTNAELYRPSTNSTQATGSPSVRCDSCAWTKLNNGKVLFAGGIVGGSAISSAEIFDPALGTWTAAANMPSARTHAAAVALNSGLVLVLGGTDGSVELDTAVLYNHATDTWTAAGSLMTMAREGMGVTKLLDGRVLIAGGQTIGSFFTNTAEIYNPATNTFGATGSLVTGRRLSEIVTLQDGRVLAAGGDFGGIVHAVAEVWNPITGAFSSVNPMTTARREHTVTLLPNGQVLILGGSKVGTPAYISAEIFDPIANMFTRIADMETPHNLHRATLLANGQVMISGGSNGSSTTNAVEFYTPQQ